MLLAEALWARRSAVDAERPLLVVAALVLFVVWIVFALAGRWA